ncbi:MAG TPA: MerR family transcriptional regulator [Vicinamibacterales bacterium]|jgi:DNA-binding transcriptional MerR regulator|nr:MerR family transcriptional regulator [Vicinamibacterales bacterium]
MSDSTGARGYQIHEFARLTGLTVRALQHYDHLGLLKPVRSRAGHRTYSDQDLQALVQILALKSVGVPLRQIAALRRSGGPGLARALHMQRAVLERRRPLLERAITAIQNVELALEKGEEADPATLRSLIEAVGPQEDLPPGLDDAPAEAARAPAPRTPDRAELRRRWQQLLDDVAQVAHSDPAGPEAQAIAGRWVDLLQELAGSGAALDAQLVKSAAFLGAAARTHSNGTPAERAWEFVGRALAARGADSAGAGASVTASSVPETPTDQKV